jgi:sortilin
VQTSLEAELLSLAWTGEDDEWVWAITSGTSSTLEAAPRHVYWSKDHGRSMKDRFPDLVKLVAKVSTKGSEHFASVSQIFVNEQHQSKVLLWGDGPFAFASDDGGETLVLVSLPKGTIGLAHQVRPHPYNHDWLLTLAERNDCILTPHFGCAKDLWLTKDFGYTWTNLTAQSKGMVSGFLDFDWGFHNKDEEYKKLFEKTTILATAHTRQYDSLQYIIQDDVHLYRTEDEFKNVRKLASCGAAFALLSGQVFFVHPDICDMDITGKPSAEKALLTRRDALTLYVSRDGTNFAEVCLPTQLSDAAYTMVSTQDRHGNFIIADHHDSAAAVSNMYANGNIAELYTLSLRNVHFGFRRGSKPDIKVVKPIIGRYIVNTLQSPFGPLNDRTFDAVTVTKVTHNAGASWKLIAVDPSKVIHPVCKSSCPKGQPCYLHLHGASSWVRGSTERPSVYAAPSAPGLVMASGNLGPEKQGLSTDKDKLCTWLSRDGGLTWVDVVDDLYIYEYLNHGNIIVLAKFREEGTTDSVLASLDQGQCWYKIRLVKEGDTDVELRVNNILVEPDGAATIAHIAAARFVKSLNKQEDVVITIDIKEVLSKQDVNGTTLKPRAKCGPGDFEKWTVTDDIGHPLCIMGEKHTFQRMALTTGDDGCFLEKNYTLAQYEVEKCDCKKEDLYCEYGYEKANSNSMCTAMRTTPPKCVAIEKGVYKPSSSHFRTAHGEVCRNLPALMGDTDGNGNMKPTDWHSQTTGAPSPRAKKGGSHFWLWAMVIIVSGLAAAAVFAYGPPPVRAAGLSLMEGCIGVALWVTDRAKALVQRVQGDRPEEFGFERLGDSEQESLYAVP